VNERIRAREVRVIDENGAQLGIIQTRDALTAARERGLDLIEVAPTATPPVCRIMDYGKWKYEQAKRDKEARKKHKQAELRLIRVRPNIDDHDFEFKSRLVHKFLEEGDKVKVNVLFRSREMSHPEFARNLLERFIEQSKDVSHVEKPASMEGRMMSIILSPSS